MAKDVCKTGNALLLKLGTKEPYLRCPMEIIQVGHVPIKQNSTWLDYSMFQWKKTIEMSMKYSRSSEQAFCLCHNNTSTTKFKIKRSCHSIYKQEKLAFKCVLKLNIFYRAEKKPKIQTHSKSQQANSFNIIVAVVFPFILVLYYYICISSFGLWSRLIDTHISLHLSVVFSIYILQTTDINAMSS